MSATLDPIVIVSAARTPIGGLLGDFSSLAGHQLGAIAIKAAIARAGVPGDAVDEVAAVIAPSFLNAGLRPGILSSLALNGCSSNLITVSPLLPGKVTGAISQSKLPSSLAFFERSVEAIANASIASRLNWYLATHSSANTPIALPVPLGSRS